MEKTWRQGRLAGRRLLWHSAGMTLQKRRAQAARVLEALAARYPEPASHLDYRNPWELLVATVLAAQCTDARVNTVTPELFRRWPGPAELAEAGQEELEEVIHSTGFYRNKAKNLRAAARRTPVPCRAWRAKRPMWYCSGVLASTRVLPWTRM